MPYAPHSRLTFIGAFGSKAAPYEEWSFRLNLFPVMPDPSPSQPEPDVPGTLSQSVTAFTTHLAPLLQQQARLVAVKYARIGADGKYVADPQEISCDVAGGGTTGDPHPTQVALAVSLGTGKRGASYRGRFFLPTPKAQVVSSGLISTADAQAAANGAASFITAVNAAPIGGVTIASSKGMLTTVTTVRTGRVLDTIRSRRQRLSEGYLASVTAPTQSI